MRTWARCGAALTLAATIGLGGCGDDAETPAGSVSGTGAGTTRTTEHDEHDEHAGHGSEEGAAFQPDEADITVPLTMKDFAFAGIPATVKGGKVLFEATNEGPSEHELVVFEKGADEAVRGFEPIAKGKTQMLAVELEPGAYTARCLVKVGDQTHADLGMQTDFTVG